MDFKFTQDQNVLQSAIVDFLDKLPFDNAYWREKEEKSEWPIEFCTAMAEGGWLGALTPEEYGGAGLPIQAGAAILETIHQSGCTAGACHAQMYTMGTVLRHGSAAQKSSFSHWL